MSEIVTPLDPDSPKGREVAERLTQVLAEIRLELARKGISAANVEPVAARLARRGGRAAA